MAQNISFSREVAQTNPLGVAWTDKDIIDLISEFAPVCKTREDFVECGDHFRGLPGFSEFFGEAILSTPKLLKAVFNVIEQSQPIQQEQTLEIEDEETCKSGTTDTLDSVCEKRIKNEDLAVDESFNFTMDTQNDPLWGLKMPEDELSVDVREQSEVEEPEVEVFEDQIEPEIDSEPKLEVQPKHKLPFAPLPSPTLKIRHDSELWSSTSAQKPKRTATKFSAAQKELLEELFKQSEDPSIEQKKELAKKSGLTLDQVKKWFQNKRYKMRKAVKNSQEVTESQNDMQKEIENLTL